MWRPDTLAVPFLLLFATAACGDGTDYQHILTAGASVPSVYDDSTLTDRIDSADGVDREVTRVSAFVHGERTWYWLFGEAAEQPMPAWVLCERTTDDGCEPVDHPYVIDALPGDEGYSPFGQVYWVPVTGKWHGELLTSREAIDEAVSEGLVEEPEKQLRFLHCPVVHPDVRVEVGPDEWVEPGPVYYRGQQARCFDFSATRPFGYTITLDELVIVRNVYVLTRDGESAPLSEPMRMMDLTGDGDTNDSNQIFGVGLGDPDYTPLWRMVPVTVPAGYASIDTSMDELTADYTSSDDMFETDADYHITPIDGRVVDYELTDVLLDCPLQSASGSL